MVQIGNVKIESPLFLAPMAGMTDLAFRRICSELGAGLTYSEMVSAKALWYGDSKTESLLQPYEGEKPYAVQIFGSDPECMAFAARRAVEISGADILDINMGCPVGKIVKSGDGSALMRTPELAAEIVSRCVAAAGVPVTVKIRKGWDKGCVNAVEFALAMQEAGAAAVTVHGRTRAQMYSGKADWYIIRDVKSALTVPVIANGDIFAAEDAVHILKYTGADAAMIGRGAFGNPWLFEQSLALIQGREKPDVPSLDRRVDLAVRQIELAAKEKGERTAVMQSRKYYPWYLRGVAHASVCREKIVKSETLEDIYRVTEQIKRELC